MLRRRPGLSNVAVLTCLLTATVAWGFDFSRYQPQAIGDLISEHTPRSGLVITPDIPIRTKVRYTGEFRALPAASRRLIDAWADAMNVPRAPSSFRQELKVTEAGTDYWLPVQEALVPIMTVELQASEEVELFVTYVGQVDGRHLLLVNAFDHERAH